VILVVGEGADKQKLVQLVQDNRLENIRIFPGQPRPRIPAIIAASDICLVLLRKSELFKTVIPTKMLEFMSCGRSLVAGLEGESAELIRNADAGICVTPGDAPALAEAIRSLYADSQLAQRFAAHSRAYVVDKLSRESTSRDYLTLLKKFCGSGEKMASPLPAVAVPDGKRSASTQE